MIGYRRESIRDEHAYTLIYNTTLFIILCWLTSSSHSLTIEKYSFIPNSRSKRTLSYMGDHYDCYNKYNKSIYFKTDLHLSSKSDNESDDELDTSKSYGSDERPPRRKRDGSDPKPQQRKYNKRNYRNENKIQSNQNVTDARIRKDDKYTRTNQSKSYNKNNPNYIDMSKTQEKLLKRITQLEALAASQQVEIYKLKQDCNSLTETLSSFSQVIALLRQAGLSMNQSPEGESPKNIKDESKSNKNKDTKKTDTSLSSSAKKGSGSTKDTSESSKESQKGKDLEYFDQSEIFGSAPSSVTDAADAAGASVLAALLGGKQRMLVDVRDAELTRDPEVLVQFIELTILPVAAGLEGLNTEKNRVKILFPTVSQLLDYRRVMAIAAPEVVSLSTLGFDPIQEKDNLVFIVAPSPDDEAGLEKMNELLSSKDVKQPIIVLNHHMVPLSGPGSEYEPVYHLRLLSVQYMTEASLDQAAKLKQQQEKGGKLEETNTPKSLSDKSKTNESSKQPGDNPEKEDAALEAAMEHAHELGIHQGITRAMVIRAYPRPWHVFVDTSPDSDADFEVAATFDEAPTQEDVNFAIVECLEGSEREDELVAQQMQLALEAGQLGLTTTSEEGEEDEDEDEDDDYWNWDPWNTDTV